MWRRRIFLIKVKISCSFSPVFLPKTKPPLYIGGQEVENNRKNCAVYLIFHDPPDRNQEFFSSRHTTQFAQIRISRAPMLTQGSHTPSAKPLPTYLYYRKRPNIARRKYTHTAFRFWFRMNVVLIPHILIKTPTNHTDNTERRFLINTLTSRTAPNAIADDTQQFVLL